jgi:acetyl-CoA acetyltransferase
MRRAAIVCPLRTPVGTFGGSLRSGGVDTLGATVVKAILERTGLDGAKIDEVVFGHSYATGEVLCTGRYIALAAGLPIEVPGQQLDRRCGSGLQAVINAALMVQTGDADVVLAGGVESMSNVEYYTTDMRWGPRSGLCRASASWTALVLTRDRRKKWWRGSRLPAARPSRVPYGSREGPCRQDGKDGATKDCTASRLSWLGPCRRRLGTDFRCSEQ